MRVFSCDAHTFLRFGARDGVDGGRGPIVLTNVLTKAPRADDSNRSGEAPR